jgi:hypothetical protein
VPGQHCLLAEGDINWRTEAHLRQYIGTPMSPAPIVLVLVLYCMPGFFSSRPNWDLLTPEPTGECVPQAVPGGDTLAGEGSQYKGTDTVVL